MAQGRDEIKMPTETLREFVETPDGVALPSLAALFRRLAIVLVRVFESLNQNDKVLRQFWQPGDVKLSLRQPHEPMPGFILWNKRLLLSKAEYPALYAAVGDGNSEDPAKFELPDPDQRYLQVAADTNKVGLDDHNLFTSGALPHLVLRLTLWIKT